MRETESVRRRLLDAAVRRFDADGMLEATIDDIRRDAGVSVGAVYHHFPDKAALHAAAWLDAMTTYQHGFLTTLRAHASAEAGIKAAVAYQLRWSAAHRESASLLFGARPSVASVGVTIKEYNRAFFTECGAWWRTHVQYGAVRDLDLKVVGALWLGPARDYSSYGLAGPTKRVATALVDTFAEAAWQALRAPR